MCLGTSLSYSYRMAMTPKQYSLFAKHSFYKSSFKKAGIGENPKHQVALGKKSKIVE